MRVHVANTNAYKQYVNPTLITIAIGALALSFAAFVVYAVTPTNGGTVSGSTIAIDTSVGDQLDPHVSGDLAAYTDAADLNGQVIRYYDFLNPASPNAAIPLGAAGDIDTLSDVNGHHIAFSRFNGLTGAQGCMVFNVNTLTTVQIGPDIPAAATALGGDTVAFVSNGEIVVGRISDPSAPLTYLTLSSEIDKGPAVSPAGDLVVWASCPTAFSPCIILRSTLSGGVWSAPALVRSAPAANPDTDGTNIVFDSAGDVFYQPAGGGPAVALEIDGIQENPSISGGVIAFESSVDAIAAADLFVYQISTNTMFRVTETLLTEESLNDVTVLESGQVRVVWAADDDVLLFAHNIYARTFPFPAPTPTPGYDFDGFFQPVDNLPAVNLASAGSSIPVKFSLGGDHGSAIFAAGYPASSPVACDASEPGSAIEETVNSGGSSLSYDAASDKYTYIWKTNKSWRGTCRMFVLGLDDGSQHLAKFQFR